MRALARRARALMPVALLLCALGLSKRAGAESTAPGGLRGLLHVRSADVSGHGVLEFGVFSHLHTLEAQDESRHYFLVGDLQIGYGLSPFLELGVDLPLRMWTVSPSDASTLESTRHIGFGDLQASGKLQLPLPWQRLKLGAVSQVTAPTGSGSRGFSTESTDLQVGLLTTLDFSDLDSFIPTRLHLNASYKWNRNETVGSGLAPLEDITAGGFWPPSYPRVPLGEGQRYNDQLLLRGGLEFNTRILSLFTELSADLFPNIKALDLTDQAVFVTQGALVKFRNGLNLKMAVDVSLQNDKAPEERINGLPVVPALPDWRMSLGLTWRRSLTLGDRDHDGVPNKRDPCPDDAEDFDGYEDEDGCPDLDNDGDGVPDRDDLAPDLVEDLDGFEDDDGRPDLDNDGDGIRDTDDACPNDPEDFDGDQDTDGCPDVVRDADRDGVPDAQDRCPEEPEDLDGFEDEDGCPDADNDGDGVPDQDDSCPDAAETVNNFEDEDGCPDSLPIEPGTILQGLNFATGRHTLPADADGILADLLRTLRDHPALVVEIRGYTDDRGDADANRVLSERRAEAVRDGLVARGVDAKRLRVRGLGELDPIASNETAAGRARNRRIEIWPVQP